MQTEFADFSSTLLRVTIDDLCLVIVVLALAASGGREANASLSIDVGLLGSETFAAHFY